MEQVTEEDYDPRDLHLETPFLLDWLLMMKPRARHRILKPTSLRG